MLYAASAADGVTSVRELEFPDLRKRRSVGVDRKLALFVVRHRRFLDDVEVVGVERLSLIERELHGEVEHQPHCLLVDGGTIRLHVGLAGVVDLFGELVAVEFL